MKTYPAVKDRAGTHGHARALPLLDASNRAHHLIALLFPFGGRMTMTKLNAKLALPVVAACLAAFSPAAAGSAPDGDQQRPRYINKITGEPEKDTFGYLVSVPDPQSVAAVIWSDAADYVGTRSGDAESDTFGRRVLPPEHRAARSSNALGGG